MTVMIDWITAKVPLRHSEQIHGGRKIEVTPDGDIKYDTPMYKPIEGTYSQNLSIKTIEVDHQGNGKTLLISGNPTKWFQGHNIFGTDDVCGLVYETMLRLCTILEIQPSPEDLRAWQHGDYSLSRIDINAMYSLGCRKDVNAWLNAAHKTARTRMGVGVLTGGTVYWGKHSSRWAIKAYSKGEEINKKGHKLPPELSLTSLLNYADDKLRLEITLRQKELKKYGLEKGSTWHHFEVQSLYEMYRDKLQMSDQKLTSISIVDLPNCVRGTYQLWSDGHDCRQILSERTFYRHRGQLLKHGIDISIPKGDVTTNVVPLIRVLEAIPVGVPDWAEGTSLYFEPRKLQGLKSIALESTRKTTLKTVK
jgi:II/X family phage/plasmid replication protein